MQNTIDAKIILHENLDIKDVEITTIDKKFMLLGPAGLAREESLIKQYENRDKGEVLPVFIGFGVGHAIALFLEKYKDIDICIIDKEEFVFSNEYNKIREEILANPRVHFINDTNQFDALNQLTKWQVLHNHLVFFPIVNSQYLRIDSAYYKELQNHLTASLKYDFWAKARKKRFQSDEVTFLFIASKYFLMGELVSACERIGIKSKLLILQDEELGSDEFISLLLENVIELQPDAIFTLNHLGMDSTGILTDLLYRLELPLISWFLDNPHLVLHEHQSLKSDWLSIFTYDKDNVPSLNAAGYNHVHFLPLGTDTERFHPRNAKKDYPQIWDSEVSFVGNSMISKVASRIDASMPNERLLNKYDEISNAFVHSSMHSVYEFIKENYNDYLPDYHALGKLERRQAFEALITWNATKIYRHDCVSKIIEFNPTIVGDPYWKDVFKFTKAKINYLDAISYYDLLPLFYTHSKINFNSTSKQMKNAINQRAFDVTASGSFIITDWREQMDELLENGKEVISYKELDEIPDLVKFYLKNESARQKIVEKGRERVLAEHSWEKRILKIIEIMKKRYA